MCPSAETFWTIMSMLIPASASGRKTRPATPGWSGTPSDGHLRLAGVVRDAGDDCLFEHVFLLDDPRALLARGTTSGRGASLRGCERTRPTAASARARLTPTARASPRTRPTSSLRAFGHDARVGREHAVDVGVDLADVRVERGGERDGGRVGAAAAERRHVLVGRDALEAGDDRDLARPRAPRARGRGASRRCAPCRGSCR